MMQGKAKENFGGGSQLYYAQLQKFCAHMLTNKFLSKHGIMNKSNLD